VLEDFQDPGPAAKGLGPNQTPAGPAGGACSFGGV
jgi:hypothetical protein